MLVKAHLLAERTRPLDSWTVRRPYQEGLTRNPFRCLCSPKTLADMRARPRQSVGIKSLRGDSTFVQPGAWEGPVSTVREVAVTGSVNLLRC